MLELCMNLHHGIQPIQLLKADAQLVIFGIKEMVTLLLKPFVQFPVLVQEHLLLAEKLQNFLGLFTTQILFHLKIKCPEVGLFNFQMIVQMLGQVTSFLNSLH